MITIKKTSHNLMITKQAAACRNGYIFNQINNFKINIYNILSHIIIHYLKNRIPMCQKKFLPKISKNRDYIQTFCNDRRNPFHFAFYQWYFVVYLHVFIYKNIYKYSYTCKLSISKYKHKYNCIYPRLIFVSRTYK